MSLVGCQLAATFSRSDDSNVKDIKSTFERQVIRIPWACTRHIHLIGTQKHHLFLLSSKKNNESTLIKHFLTNPVVKCSCEIWC